MRIRFTVVLSILIFSQISVAIAKGISLKVSDPAPPLNAKAILQAPAGTRLTWAALRGKVAVIEFWATWCGPCLGAIPHWNELAAKFKGKPVQFISITEPPETSVGTFLQVNPIHSWIVLDPSSSVAKRYGVRGIPQTFIVDPQGRIAAITGPERLTEAVLNAALEGKAIKLPSEAALRGVGGQPASMQNVLVDVLIRANVPRDLGTRRFSQAAAGMPLKDMVATFYDVNPLQIVWPTPTPDLDMSFQYRVALPENRSGQFFPFAQQALKAALALKAHWETRQMNVLVLKGPSGELGPMLKPANKSGALGSGGPGAFTGHGVAAGAIAASIEARSNRIVINETDLHGIYNVTLYWNPRKPASIFSAVQKQLGLEVVPGKRPVRVLVIDHINLPAVPAK